MAPGTPDVVLALGFDLFFRPKVQAAGKTVGVDVRFAAPPDAPAQLAGAARVVADVSAPGVEDALRRIRAADAAVPILACYPHVETARADAVRAMGGVAVPRGTFNARLEDALAGRLA